MLESLQGVLSEAQAQCKVATALYQRVDESLVCRKLARKSCLMGHYREVHLGVSMMRHDEGRGLEMAACFRCCCYLPVRKME